MTGRTAATRMPAPGVRPAPCLARLHANAAAIDMAEGSSPHAWRKGRGDMHQGATRPRLSGGGGEGAGLRERGRNPRGPALRTIVARAQGEEIRSYATERPSPTDSNPSRPNDVRRAIRWGPATQDALGGQT